METVARNAEQSLVLHKTRRAGDLTARSLALADVQEGLDLGAGAAADRVLRRLEPAGHRRRRVDGRVRGRGGAQVGVPPLRRPRSRRGRGHRRRPRHPRGGLPTVPPLPRRAVGGDRRRARARPPPTTPVDSRASTRTPVGRASSRTRRTCWSSTAVRPRWRRRRRPWTSWASTTSPSPASPSGSRRCGCPGRPDPVVLPRTSEGLYLLQRVRDEAHRFAITYHRQRRSRRMVDSLLDQVPGLGEIGGRRCSSGSARSSGCGPPLSTSWPRCPGSARRPRRPSSQALADAPAAGPAVDMATGEILP